MENNNRGIYIAIFIVFIVLLGIIIYLESTDLSSEDADATVDARVVAILTDADYESTYQTQIDSVNATGESQIANLSGTNEARETQIALDFPSTAEAQRGLVLTDVAIAYPSETMTPSPTATPTSTATATITSTPTLTPSPTPRNPDTDAPIRENVVVSNLLLNKLENGYVDFAWSPDETQFATSFFTSTAGELRVYNSNDLTDYQTIIDLDRGARQISWSDDGRFIAVSDISEMIRIVDTETWEELHSFPTDEVVFDFLWTADSQYLIGVTAGELYVWDVESAKLSHTYELNESNFTDLDWNEDFSYFAVSDNRDFEYLSIEGNGHIKELDDLSPDIDNRIMSLDISPDGQFIAISVDELEEILLWNIADESETFLFDGHSDTIHMVSWSPNSEYIVTSGADGVARVWEVASNRLIYILNHGDNNVWESHWASDGTLVTNSQRGLYFWNLNIELANTEETTVALMTPTKAAELETTPIAEEPYEFLRIDIAGTSFLDQPAWSPDSQHIAFGTSDSDVIIYNMPGDEEIRRLSGLSGFIWALDWSPDGTMIAAGDSDQRLNVWDAQTGELITALRPGFPSNEISWSADGRYLAAALFGGVKVWRTEDWELIGTGDSGFSYHIAWAYNTNTLVFQGLGFTLDYLTVTRDGNVATSSRSFDSGIVEDVAISPDSRFVATAGRDGIVNILNYNNAEINYSLIEHFGQVNALAFSPDGRFLASGGSDDTVVIWNLENTGSNQKIIA